MRPLSLFSLLLIVGFATGCSDDSKSNSSANLGNEQNPGAGNLITSQTEPAGNNCASGGYALVQNEQVLGYVCNGTDGQDGQTGGNGAPGADGSSVVISTEPAGKNCTAGGFRLSQDGQVLGYVCDGEQGANGQSVSVDNELPGQNCTSGGVALSLGSQPVMYVCNGTNGQDGVDGQDGTNGQNGADGQDGTNGTNGLSIDSTPEAAGTNCPFGGFKLERAGVLVGYLCSGNDSGNRSLYINENDVNCSDDLAGTQLTPNCSLEAAIQHAGVQASIFVARGAYAEIRISKDLMLT